MLTIAEIAQAHNGNIDTAHAYIDAVATTGTAAIKFQTHIADAESSIHEPFRIKLATQDKTRFDYWKRMEFTQEQWIEIGVHCKKVGLKFISSPFSNKAVDILEAANVDIYKIGSGEVNNLLLLKKIVATKKPIIVSSGMSSFEELDITVAFLKEHNANFSILQCTTSYPTHPNQYGLNVISELKNRYSIPVGFSDHSAQIATGIAAVALGAEILEFHVIFDRNELGPDVTSSLTIIEATQLVTDVNEIYQALKNPIDKINNAAFKELKQIFEKSLAVNKDLAEGDILTFEDLEAKKPKGFGIAASEFEKIIGRKLSKSLKKWDFLTEDDLK